MQMCSVVLVGGGGLLNAYSSRINFEGIDLQYVHGCMLYVCMKCHA